MERKTKEISSFSLINMFLLTIAVIIATVFFFTYNENLHETETSEYDIENDTEKIIVVADKNTNEEITTVAEPIINSRTANSSAEANNNRFYYNQLDDVSKTIYTYVEDNIENIKTGTYTINLPKSVSRVDDTDELNVYFQSALDALMMDRVDLFYIDVTKISLNIKTITFGADISRQLYLAPNNDGSYLSDEFQNKASVNYALEKINSIANSVASNAYGNKYDQIKYVHDWLIDNLEYDSQTGNNAYTIYGALIEKRAVCEGYAEAFKYIMDKLNIPCVLVSGTATNSSGETENHEWNEVQLNGNWYAIDVTWDDPILINGGSLSDKHRYKYFLKGSSNITTNHFPNGKFSNTGIEFKYPELQYMDY